MTRPIAVFATFGLLCGIVAVVAYELWWSAQDYAVDDNTYEPLGGVSTSRAFETSLTITTEVGSPPWWLFAIVLALPTALGVVIGGLYARRKTT